MAEAITLNIDTQGDIDEAVQALRGIRGGAREVIARAFNKTAVALKDYAGEEVPKEFDIPARSVKALTKVARANASSTDAVVSRAGPGLFASRFNFDANENPGVKGGRPVRLRPRHSGSGYLLNAEGEKSKAFVATMRNRHTGNLNSRGSVFRRVSSDRVPLEKPIGPSVPEMLGELPIRSAIQERAAAKLQTELDREIRALLKKGAG